LPLDVHLMVEHPRRIVPLFQEAGADWISIHVEATHHLHKDIQNIKESGQKAGLALNPATPIHLMNEIIKDLDFILIMTVNPGWGGQKFIESCHKKITHLRHWLEGQKLDIPIQVDGGIKLDNMENLIENGANILVVGSGIYKDDNPAEVLKEMKTLVQRYENL
jgi:ribulose-phosphate 3-epimerase